MIVTNNKSNGLVVITLTNAQAIALLDILLESIGCVHMLPPESALLDELLPKLSVVETPSCY